MAVASLECSGDWREAQRMNKLKYGQEFVDAGVADELRDVALRLAPEPVAMISGMRAPQDDGERAQLHYTALGMAKDTLPLQGRIEAIAWMAYFSDRGAQGSCPPDPELLRLIGKQP